MDTTPAPTGAGRSQLTRRAVVRTAAHAAWAVPLVQVATAAPALAVSGMSLGVSAVLNSWSASTTSATFSLTVTVTNTGSGSVAVSAVTLSFPSGWNPTSSVPAGWARSGNGTSTLSYTPTTALTLAANATATFTVTLNPVDSYVGAGTYVSDGGGLTVVAMSSTPGVTITPAVVDIPGLYANLVITGGSAAWTRTGTPGNYQYFLPATATVTNRGRTATSTLEVAGSVSGLGSSTGNPINVAAGWTYQTNGGNTRYVRTGTQLAAGQSVPFGTTRQMTGIGVGTSGTITLTPRDAGTGNEVARALDIPVAAYS